MDIRKESLNKHYEWGGKIGIAPRVRVETPHDLSLAYTPGVAEACLAIKESPELSYELTRRHNLVAVVTDGSAVLGLGDIGPEAGMPVMEGKCLLFREFAGIDAFPICIRSKDPDEIVRTVSLIAGSFGGINLEDISAPRCFEIERRLIEACDIPVFHDDQHGTAIVVAAALLNALKLTGKRLDSVRITICGAGAAGIAIARHLSSLGADPGKVTMCNSRGIICEGDESLNPAQTGMARLTNRERKRGSLADAMVGADVFIGVSAPGIVSPEMVRSMADGAIVFAMANPTPEIMPDLAKAAGAAIVGTGRSDFPNQINNLLAFPGVFRGALDSRTSRITESMKAAASYALAGMITDAELNANCILPSPLDKRVVSVVAAAVAACAAGSAGDAGDARELS